MHVFHALVAAHIATGATGALAFWVPVIGRKGGVNHKRWGRIFTYAMLATGSFAVCMSVLTLVDPMATHPHLEGMFDAVFIRAIFGWLMLHMGILTINLAWYGFLCVRNKRVRDANRTPLNLALQGVLLVAALNCALQGWLSGQYLLIGLSLVGIATAWTNLHYLYRAKPGVLDWLKEHIKALVGAGISVYTAFLAFGSVRLLPELALNPLMWAVPLVTGVSMIIFHQRKVTKQLRARRDAGLGVAA
ncbi:hypothetical protein GXW79_13900 [Roseomonas arctica]|uniref:DUF2306 domain-containing protein n=1 Tax=Plastoroseomonas arctica TaxID=1509237 RepID=A0AAF1KMB9_9PROT|nr:hypothetical protein [Plastoroseomonas arctica]